MRLFIRDHRTLVAMQIVQLFLVLLIYWLDGYRHFLTGLYSVFVGLVLLTGYLVYRYVSLRQLYRTLSEPMAELDDSIQGLGSGPLPEAVDALLQSQYGHYQRRIKLAEKARKDHLAFMNQWVHQMKTPLAVIRLTMEEDDPRSASVLEEAERMEKGLETVLYAARLETFDRDFRVEPVSLKAICENAIRDNKRLFIGSKVYPDLQVDAGLKVESDSKWLGFLVGQIVTNAVKYSADSHEKVTFSSLTRGADAVLEIHDRGIGIPPEDIKRVFQPFFTGGNGRKRKFRESTGMGLYFVREIAERLGHRIELESEPGVGTRVRIVFASHLTSV
ncbi:sensor histidine kinase [Cohnella sp.]|uniref:sensor histidine kinase n=1 Tax=Cohnella sp. TaxID=1883426 RepID=UPI003568608C